MRSDQLFHWTVISTIALGVAGCGLKGPLYLPDKAANVEVRPAQAPQPTDDSQDAQKKAPSPSDPAAAPGASNPAATPSGKVAAPPSKP